MHTPGSPRPRRAHARNCRAGRPNSRRKRSGTCRRVPSGAAALHESGPLVMPVISVIIPIWNRAHSAGKAIESALSQALPSGHTLEIIVVDDGSNDQPEVALERFGAKIKLVRHATNL